MNCSKLKIITIIFLFLSFYGALYSQNKIIQICTVRSENEEGIRELGELSSKMIAYDPDYKIHKDTLIRACNYVGIFNNDNPPPEFPSLYEFDSQSDLDKLKIARELIQGKISAVLIIEDLHPDLVSIIWEEICELHNIDKSKFLAINLIAVPARVIERMNEYMRSKWYKPFEIPSFEYFTYRKIDTARIIAVSPTSGIVVSFKGSITDREENPLPGVTVAVTGSSLMGKKTTVTGIKGSYRFLLPEGIYTVEASMEGFKTSEFDNLLIREEMTKELNFIMEISPLEAVSVVVTSPVVDAKKTAIAKGVYQDMLKDLLVGRDLFEIVIAEESAIAENAFYIEPIEEVEVAGYEAEFRGFPEIEGISRSGTNRFQGELYGYFTLKSLTERSPSTYRAGSFLGYDEYDLNLNFSGPIIKDKLWFFSWYSPDWSSSDYETIRKTHVSEQLFNQNYGGKLTYVINSHHRLTFGLLGNRKIWNDLNQSMNVLEPVKYNKIRNSWSFYSSHEFIINDSMFLNTKISLQQNHNEYNPEKNIPLYEDGTSSGRFSQGYGSRVYFGGTSLSGWDKRNWLRGQTCLNWFVDDFVGSHELKFGAEYVHALYEAFLHPNGPGGDVFGTKLGAYWRMRDWGYYNRYYVQNSRGDMDVLSFFTKDSWSVSRFNINLGLRMTQYLYKGYGESAEKIRLNFGKSIAPTVGFRWDIMADGRLIFSGHYDKFYKQIPLNIVSRILSHEQYDFYYYNLPTNNQLPSWDNPGLPKDELYEQGVLHIGKNVNVTDIKSQYTQEAVLSIEYELSKNLYMRLSSIYRSLEDVVGGVSFDEGVNITLTNPSEFRGIDSSTGKTLVFPELERKFTGLEFNLHKIFSNNYHFFISYLLSKNEGNIENPFYLTKREPIPDIASLFYIPDLLENAYGPLENDRTHRLKASGSYRFKFGLFVSCYLNYLSGFPLSKLGEHLSYGTKKIFLEERGSAGRSSPFFSLDIFLEYPINLESKSFTIMLNVLNLTNHHSPLSIDQEWNWGIYNADQPFQTNHFWREHILYQSPRVIKFGLKFIF